MLVQERRIRLSISPLRERKRERGGERERETERQTDRQTETERELELENRVDTHCIFTHTQDALNTG